MIIHRIHPRSGPQMRRVRRTIGRPEPRRPDRANGTKPANGTDRANGTEIPNGTERLWRPWTTAPGSR